MDRRTFISSLSGAMLSMRGQAQPRTAPVKATPSVVTVRGAIDADQLGRVLAHEHVLVDFVGADVVSPARYDPTAVFDKALPHLRQAASLGFRTLVECTPNFLARDVRLLARLSAASGMHILTNTGLYGTRQNKFLPRYASTESAQQLARRWTGEAQDGIDGTDIRPGFIKCGVDPEPTLSEMHRKLVDAAGITHLATGLTIAVHTGRGPGLQQLDVLRELGVAPAAYVWVHAQGARDDDLFAAADRGAWISLDGLNPASLSRHLHLCAGLKERGHLERILLSHDAGWYDPAKPDGGTFRAFDLLATRFMPMLREQGFTAAEVEQLASLNPSRAFTLRVRTT